MRARTWQRPWRWPQPRQQRQGAFECLLERGRPAAAEAVAEAVQCALQCALEQRRVAIVALLLSHRASLSQVNLPALYTCASVSDATAAALATSASLTTLRSCPVNVRSSSAEEQRQMYEEGVLPFLVSNACTSSPRRPHSSSPQVRGGRAALSCIARAVV